MPRGRVRDRLRPLATRGQVPIPRRLLHVLADYRSPNGRKQSGQCLDNPPNSRKAQDPKALRPLKEWLF